jgi:hypothetical protein
MFEYIGDLLVPQTEGFGHVNMDMAFTYLGQFDLFYVNNISLSITLSHVYSLKQSEYLLRGILATYLNSHKSLDAKSMNILTTVVTQNKQEFEDKTAKKQGFSWFGFGKKPEQTAN